MRILLIDDNAGIRALTRELIEQTGCCTVVGEAERAEAAVSAVGQHRPELVVMDWAMPGHDGIWATRQLKVIFPNVEVVAFTSMIDADLERRFADAGATAHFEKADLFRLVEWIVEHAGSGNMPTHV